MSSRSLQVAHAARHRFRDHRPSSRSRRILRSSGLRSGPAQEGDRHPPGPRKRYGDDLPPHPLAGHSDLADRLPGRDCRNTGPAALRGEPALRRRSPPGPDRALRRGAPSWLPWRSRPVCFRACGPTGSIRSWLSVRNRSAVPHGASGGAPGLSPVPSPVVTCRRTPASHILILKFT